MKNPLPLVVLICVTGTLATHAGDANRALPPARPADLAWGEIESIAAHRRPDPRSNSLIEYYSAIDASDRKLQAASLEFIERFTDDARRWEAAYLVLQHQPSYFLRFKPEFEQDPSGANVEIDVSARDAWKVRRAELIATIQAAPDASAKVKAWVAVHVLHSEYAKADAAGRRALIPRIADVADQFPESDDVYHFIFRESTKLERRDPAAADELWQALRLSRHERLRTRASIRQPVADRATTPLELRFRALDGREIDLASMRAKVVLVDFWAMWCGPCVEEIPNVRRVYAEYRDKGFEVVGVSLDPAGAGEKLAQFLKRHEMPWPQHYDGLGMETSPAVKYSVISIPTMLLLDKTGRIVSTEARGASLEALVRKHLGLQDDAQRQVVP